MEGLCSHKAQHLVRDGSLGEGHKEKLARYVSYNDEVRLNIGKKIFYVFK